MDRFEELRRRFASEPFVTTLGARLSSLDDGQAVVEMAAGDPLTIADGIVQGGAIAALADYAGVYAAMTKLAHGLTPASNLTIHFLRPAKAGELLRAVASVLNANKRSILVSVGVFAEAKLKAQGLISFAVPRGP